MAVPSCRYGRRTRQGHHLRVQERLGRLRGLEPLRCQGRGRGDPGGHGPEDPEHGAPHRGRTRSMTAPPRAALGPLSDAECWLRHGNAAGTGPPRAFRPSPCGVRRTIREGSASGAVCGSRDDAGGQPSGHPRLARMLRGGRRAGTCRRSSPTGPSPSNGFWCGGARTRDASHERSVVRCVAVVRTLWESPRRPPRPEEGFVGAHRVLQSSLGGRAGPSNPVRPGEASRPVGARAWGRPLADRPRPCTRR